MFPVRFMLQGISSCAEDQFADQPQWLRKPEVFELRNIFLTVDLALPVDQHANRSELRTLSAPGGA